jgi:hypothetical protein
MLSTLNTLALLRITPLISSSASLFYCADQYLVFSSFITPENTPHGSKLLPGYWSTYITPGLCFIVGLCSTSAIAGLTNAYGYFRSAPASPQAAKLYAAGAAFSLAHFLFAPFVAVSIEAMVNDTEGKDTAAQMRKWLNVHTVRSLVVDLPSWVLFLLATCDSVVPL